MMRFFKHLTCFVFVAAVLTIAGCTEEKPVQPVNGDQGMYEEEVTLYFSDADANYLVADKRQVQVESTDCTTLAAKIVQELIAGPQEDSELYGIMPEGTELQTVELKENGILEVSFNQAFIENQMGGSAGMTLTLYGLVNSLGALEEVESVQVLIDGEPTEAYQGLIRADEPVVPMMEYVQPVENG